MVYPLDPIPTKFGSVLSPIRGSPNIAPNKYNVDLITSIDYLSKNMLTSDKGQVGDPCVTYIRGIFQIYHE